PTAPMAEPWATVLELSAGMTAGRTNPADVVGQLTRGIHNSLWTGLAGTAKFIVPHSTLIYDPSVVRSVSIGGSFAAQTYDLNAFMAALPGPDNIQQCNDNSNLLAIFARSLGIPLNPLWFAHVDPPWVVASDLMVPATYYPAGRTVTETHSFTFH